MKSETLKGLNAARMARQGAVVVTNLANGEDWLYCEGEQISESNLAEAIDKAFRTGKSGVVEVEASQYFLNAYLPSPRLIVIGAVHIAQALAQMAKLVDFDVVVIDPRTAFATKERFEGVELLAEWPDDVLKLDRYCALAAITHDPKIDDYPLVKALEVECFYVGALGSRKTHGKRLERLANQGVQPDKLDKICAPIGLNIGAASPSEIGLAIMAEVVQAFHQRKIG